jgi:hypothetical protein
MRAQSLLCAQYFTGIQYVCAHFYVIFRVTFNNMSSVNWFEKKKIYFRKECTFTLYCTVQFFAEENVKIRNNY